MPFHESRWQLVVLVSSCLLADFTLMQRPFLFVCLCVCDTLATPACPYGSRQPCRCGALPPIQVDGTSTQSPQLDAIHVVCNHPSGGLRGACPILPRWVAPFPGAPGGGGGLCTGWTGWRPIGPPGVATISRGF
jgi:hypothetical protein